MKLTSDSNPNTNLVRSYGKGFFVVNDERLATSIILSPDRLCPCEGVQRLADIDSGVLDQISEFDPEILLIGTGATHHLPEVDIMIRLSRLGAGVEVMRTDAACRTFNVLVSEDRRVTALLMLILDE